MFTSGGTIWFAFGQEEEAQSQCSSTKGAAEAGQAMPPHMHKPTGPSSLTQNAAHTWAGRALRPHSF